MSAEIQVLFLAESGYGRFAEPPTMRRKYRS